MLIMNLNQKLEWVYMAVSLIDPSIIKIGRTSNLKSRRQTVCSYGKNIFGENIHFCMYYAIQVPLDDDYEDIILSCIKGRIGTSECFKSKKEDVLNLFKLFSCYQEHDFRKDFNKKERTYFGVQKNINVSHNNTYILSEEDYADLLKDYTDLLKESVYEKRIITMFWKLLNFMAQKGVYPLVLKFWKELIKENIDYLEENGSEEEINKWKKLMA